MTRRERRRLRRIVRAAEDPGAGLVPLIRLWRAWPYGDPNPFAARIAEYEAARRLLAGS